jgi:hypothetical protein
LGLVVTATAAVVASVTVIAAAVAVVLAAVAVLVGGHRRSAVDGGPVVEARAIPPPMVTKPTVRPMTMAALEKRLRTAATPRSAAGGASSPSQR